MHRALLLLLPLTLAGCSPRITPERMAQVHPGMTHAQTQALLGSPARLEQAETTGVRGEVDHYPVRGGEGRVIFLNDQVFRADFVPNAPAPQP